MDKPATPATIHERPSWLEVVREQVSSMRFGHVQIVVHNAQVVQVERTERIRFNRPTPESETGSE